MHRTIATPNSLAECLRVCVADRGGNERGHRDDHDRDGHQRHPIGRPGDHLSGAQRRVTRPGVDGLSTQQDDEQDHDRHCGRGTR